MDLQSEPRHVRIRDRTFLRLIGAIAVFYGAFFLACLLIL